MTSPPEPAAPAPPAAATADGTLSDRVGKLEAGQDSLSERVDKILGILDKPEGDSPATSADLPPAADMAEQMRQAVRDVHAEAAQAEAKKPKPEVTPREAGQ